MDRNAITFKPKELEKFYRFITERHSIWHRRFVEGRPRPWTDDAILRHNKFTNIYRELDPGTQFSMDHILRSQHPRPDIVFNVMLYRLMCSIPTYSGMGFQTLSQFNEKDFDDYLRGLYETGEPVFGNAYLISPYSSMGSKYKFRNVARLFGHLHQEFGRFFERLDKASSMEEAFKVINSQYGFGPFLAFQVLVDLTYKLPPDDHQILTLYQNDWARLGPGALRGFARLSRSTRTLNGLKWLWRNQHVMFSEYGLDFPFLKDREGNEVAISLPNMQNCLCEFHKYRSIQDGTGKSQRLFVPKESRV